ncbi:unnamed protein product [Lymnaea stagnalis]|uniref:C1q domain-containing protein n=1 Tax=Lymnaea stagnalis TaxID=6523 RepID=A0AAV2I136_LYMST
MAKETTHRQITFLNQELNVLLNEAEQLKNGIDIYSTRVINKAKVWIDGQGRDQVKFVDLLQKVQDATVLIAEKCKEINDFNELQDVTTTAPATSSTQIPNISESSSNDNKEFQKYLDKLDILEADFCALKCAIKKVESKQEQFAKWIETAAEKSTDHDKEIDILSEDMSKFIRTHEKQIKSQEKQIKNLSETITDVRSQSCSKFDEVMGEMSAASDFMATMKETLESLSSKVEENVAKLESVESNQHELTSSLMDQEKQLTTLGTELKDIHEKYGVLCQTLTKRLMPLVAIQEALYNKKTSIEENKSKLSSLEMKITDLSKQLSQTETQQSLAFSATTWEKQLIDSDGQAFKIKNFSNISGNAGDSFDPLAGEFTAPSNGLYFISLTIKNMNEFSILGQMLINDPETKEERGGFCCIERLLPQMCQCTATVIELQEGEKLFIRLLKLNEKTNKLDLRMKLVCLFIK